MPNILSKHAILLLCLPILAGPAFADDPVSDVVKSDLTREPPAIRRDLTEYYLSGRIVFPDEAAAGKKVRLTEAVQVALENNLELQASTERARASAAVLKGTYGLYDPRLYGQVLSGRLKSFENAATLNSFRDDYRSYSLSLEQRLPIGTTLTLSGTVDKDDFEPPLAVDPAHDTRAAISILQPLLKGFGKTVTEQAIAFAAKDRQVALQDLRQRAFDVVASVRDAFFETLQAQYELSYRETSVELARRIVRENNARVEAGILPPVEKLEAEVGLQARERILLDARNAYLDSLDRFNLLLGGTETFFVPEIEPFTMSFETSEESGIASGLLKRPDVNRRLKQIERIRIEHSVAKNSLLPELNLIASYSQSGLADHASDSLDMLKDGDYDSWEVGVLFSYPLGNVESRSELKRTEISLREQRALLSQLHKEVRNEVRAAIRDIDVSRKKTEVARKGEELAGEKLRILLKSRDVGLATTRDVLDGEEDLASARTEEITAIADYFKAITSYLRVTGLLLDNERIDLRDEFDPEGTAPLLVPAQ